LMLFVWAESLCTIAKAIHLDVISLFV